MTSPLDPKSILDNSPFAWWEWEVRTNNVLFNDLKATMLDYSPADFQGKGYEAFTRLLHPEDYEKTMSAMKTVLQGTAELYQVDYRILAANGLYHWYMDRGTVLEKDAVGKPSRIRGIVIDLGRESGPSGNIEAVLSVLRNSLYSHKGKLISSLVICSACKKAKNTKDDWIPITAELTALFGESISHGICPACIQALYPEFAGQLLE